ncbi:endonuclease domain-containing protein [Echinicola shivajiensis]|uniref:endonuclease domain-containing protein n=1 Tax=Echinicola shivajiensis TaxID=1035916 RepID=UPI001BFCCC71|nr:endonuclease domain-containing protein [Echinicola shivajiensis]
MGFKKTIYNAHYLKEKRKNLRNNGTPAEATLWKALSNKKLKGKKFRRQYSAGNYILDFYCPSERLCIELDGAHHFTEAGYKYDKERTKYLENLNISVIRFRNEEVFNSLQSVLAEIERNFTTPGPS